MPTVHVGHGGCAMPGAIGYHPAVHNWYNIIHEISFEFVTAGTCTLDNSGICVIMAAQ